MHDAESEDAEYYNDALRYKDLCIALNCIWFISSISKTSVARHTIVGDAFRGEHVAFLYNLTKHQDDSHLYYWIIRNWSI